MIYRIISVLWIVGLYSSCVSSSKLENEINVIEIEFVKCRELDRELFFQNNRKQSNKEREFNWANLSKKEYYTLWASEKESIYKRNLGLKSNGVLKSSSGIVTYRDNETELYRNQEEDFSILEIKGENFILKDSVQKLNWKLDNDEKKKILGFDVFKATSDGLEKGSTITAWYSRELPKGHGPFYYWGLPGMILEVNVSYSDIENSPLNVIKGSTIKALKITKTIKDRLNLNVKDKRVITSEQWQKEIEEYNQKLKEYSSGGVEDIE